MKLKKALKMFDNNLDLYVYGNNIKIPLCTGTKAFIKDCCPEYLKYKVLAMHFNVRGLHMNIYIKENQSKEDANNETS